MAFENKRILVVDDDHEIVELVKAVLRTKGYEILVAYDGEEGWNKLLSLRPDLVVLDLRMPGMSGMQLCKNVRANPEVARTPLLVMTGLAEGIDKPDSFWVQGLGCDDFMAKPFDALNLLGRVEYLLRKHDYISDGLTAAHVESAEGAPAQDNGSQIPGTPHPAVRHADVIREPDDVVCDFVESWNSKDFSTEYRALGDEMLGGLSQEDYVQRRAQLYADEHGEEIICAVLDCDVKISHNMATVACLREDMVRGVPHRKDERYTLKKTRDGWKIVSVRSRPMTFTVE